MISFINFLEDRVHHIDSLLCIGLDPHWEDLNVPTPQAAEEFCLRLVEKTASLTAAFKPNIAFFEVFGDQGMVALGKVIAAIPPEIPVILDAKRGDIASSSQAYARAAFEKLGAHAITVNPYLGRDALEPFLKDPAKGVFLLCKTSNPGGRDLQDLTVDVLPQAPWEKKLDHQDIWQPTEYLSLRLYEYVARLAQSWGRAENLGLVVGANQPEALRRVRLMAPDLWLLSPGVGIQGGDAQVALQAGLRSDGLGMLVNVSRGVSRASDPHQTAARLRQTINQARYNLAQSPPALNRPGDFSPMQARIADALLDSGCIKFGQFTLKSGLISPIYIDLRRLVGDPQLLYMVAGEYIPLLRRLTFDRLAALPYAALPIAAAISLLGGWSFVYPRKEVKNYGTRDEVEGIYQVGEQVVVIDDLITTGGSKFEAIERLKEVGLKVQDVVVLIDRQSGAAQALKEAGYRLHAVFSLSQLIDYWEADRKVPAEQLEAVRIFLRDQKTM